LPIRLPILKHSNRFAENGLSMPVVRYCYRPALPAAAPGFCFPGSARPRLLRIPAAIGRVRKEG
jgi:hypothetical protein